MDISHSIVMIIASFFGIGYLPFCPGTCASFVAIGVYALIAHLGLSIKVLIILILFCVGLWAGHRVEIFLKKKDPSVVVMDEIVGYLITMCFIPFNLLWALVGFFIFRLYDILKPFPIRRFERVSGGLGIMMDDILSGAYAAITLRFIQMIYRYCLCLKSNFV